MGIAAGSGISPVRGVLQKRDSSGGLSMSDDVEKRPDTLLLGFRNQAKDFLFGREWEHEFRTVENCSVAFSRDQYAKFYVQDFLDLDYEEGKEIARIHLHFPKARVIIAGASGAFPKQVKQSMTKLLQASVGDEDEKRAAKIIQKMVEEERWVQDC